MFTMELVREFFMGMQEGMLQELEVLDLEVKESFDQPSRMVLGLCTWRTLGLERKQEL